MPIIKARVAVLEADLLDADISLAALGLAAQISVVGELSFDALQARYPNVDILALVDELVSSGIFTVNDFDDAVPPPAAPGFVYVVGTVGAVKIGVTRNVRTRVKALQTSSPHKLILLFSEHVANCVLVEQSAHKELAQFRKSGEWFACTGQEAVDAVKVAIAKLSGTKQK